MRYLCTIIVALVLLSPAVRSAAQAQDPSQAPLAPVALFHRCYTSLTGLRAAPNHPILLQVKNGTLSPVDGCMQVLDKGKFVPAAQSNLSSAQLTKVVPADLNVSYTPYVIKDINDADGLAVVNRFQNLHRMFFQMTALDKLPAYSTYLDRFNDPTEPALFLTRLLFQPGAQYKEAVTGNYSVRGIRGLGPYTRNYFTGGSGVFSMASAGLGLDRGQLWGVGTYLPGNKSWFKDNGGPESTFSWTNGSSGTVTFYTFNSQRSYGGGIMGLHSYIVMNSGFPSQNSDNSTSDPTEINSGRSNASRRMMRRLTSSVIQDLLGRPLPPLRPTDVSTLVANYVAAPPDPNNQLPFRKSTNCASCHVALDTMAAIWRPYYFDRSYFTPWILPQNVGGDGTTTPTIDFISAASLRTGDASSSPQPPETPINNEYTMMKRDSLFHRRPASGDVRFRSYDGTLVWQHITATGQFDGIAKLGDVLAGTNDLYVNIAAKYFKYFTGIQVNLSDINAPGTPPLSEDDLYYRNIVIQLGLSLKNHQSLRQLVQEIFSLSMYQKIGMRDLTS